MNLEELLTYMNAGNPLVVGTEAFDCMHALSYEAQRLTMELNSASHTPEEVRDLMSRITGRDVPEDFRLFPPFYTDFGKNIRLGRGVFINSCCCFQDQGGITVGDGTLIGHRVTVATINHGLRPDERHIHNLAPVTPARRDHRRRGHCGRWGRGHQGCARKHHCRRRARDRHPYD